MKVSSNILNVLNTIDSNVCVVVATKYLHYEDMKELFKYNLYDFGENRVDSFLLKYENLKDYNIKWHFIGHLQRNKVKSVVNKIDVLHSLDSISLASLIDKFSDKVLDCFVEVKFSLKDSKHGILKSDLKHFLNELKDYKKINVIGLMTITDIDMTDNEKNNIFNELNILKNKYDLLYTSMGMSSDYLIALNNNATHIRLGSILLEDKDDNL